MEADTVGRVQSGIKALQADAQVGREVLRNKGERNGREGRPMSSLKSLDTIELGVLASYKNFLTECWQRFRKDIGREIDGLDQRLFFHSSTDKQRIEPGTQLGQARIDEAAASLERVVAVKRSELNSASEKANESNENLSEFREHHQLARHADYSRNRRSKLLIAAGVIVSLTLVLSFLIRGFEEALLMTLGLWLVTSIVVSLLSVGFAEALRGATNHLLKLRLPARVLVVLLAFVIIGVSLSFGHYRDALRSASSQQNPGEVANVESQDEPIAEQLDCSAIAAPTGEAMCRLRRYTLGIEDLISWFAFILGVALHVGAIATWHSLDDRYFRYGSVSRRAESRLEKWVEASKPVVERLDNERQSLRASTKAAYVDLRNDWQTRTRKVDELHESWKQSLAAICNACRDSILVYRTANREARPPIVGTPPHWDDEWRFPMDEEYSLPRIDDLRGHLCTHEEAIALGEKEKDNLLAVLSAIDNAYQSCKKEVENLDPQPAVFRNSDKSDVA